MWTFVNLTGVHVELDPQSLGEHLRKFGNALQKFLSEEYADAGLAVVEHTTRYTVKCLGEIEEEGQFFGYQVQGRASIIHFEPMLYIHGHAICYGGFKDKIAFERRWASKLVAAGFLTLDIIERNDARRFVGLEAVRNPKHATRYILKYVAKGIELDDIYLEGLKRLKYVRSWGFLYGMKEPTFDMICLDCGGKCYVAYDEGLILEYYGDKTETLRIQRVPREVPGPP